MMWGPVAAAQPPQARRRVPWLLLLLGGLGSGSMVSLVLNWLYRKAQQALLVALTGSPVEGRFPQWPMQTAVGNATSIAAASATATATLGATHGNTGVGMSAAELAELSKQVRSHVDQTREATATLRRAMDQQQRQYSASAMEFQRKLAEVSRRKTPAGSQRIEISPDSLQVLRSLISPPSNGSSAAGAAAGTADALQQWFSQANMGLRRLLRSAGSKVEAHRCLQTVSMVVHNLVECPGEEKYLEVNTASARFRGTLGSPESGAAELLQLAGFEPKDQCFVFPPDRSLDDAERVRDFLQAALRDSDSKWEQANDETAVEQCEAQPAASGSDPPAAAKSIDGSGGLGISAGVQRAAAVATAGAPAEASNAQPWLSSVSQKRMSRATPSSVPEPPVAGDAAAAAQGGLPALRPQDTARPMGAQVTQAAHPAEALGTSQEPQSGG